MAVPQIQYTPIRAPRGRKIHALTLREPGFTACGESIDAWVIEPGKLSCKKCVELLKKRFR